MTIFDVSRCRRQRRGAVHPDGLQFVLGWQPRGTGTDEQNED